MRLRSGKCCHLSFAGPVMVFVRQNKITQTLFLVIEISALLILVPRQLLPLNLIKAAMGLMFYLPLEDNFNNAGDLVRMWSEGGCILKYIKVVEWIR